MTETIITEFQHSQDLKTYSDNIIKAGFQKKAENKYLVFYINKKNNYFKIMQKTGGVITIPYHEDKILLLKHYREQLNQTLYELCRGFTEPKEEFQDAALRELKEETNFEASYIKHLGLVHADSGIMRDEIHVFALQVTNIDGFKPELDEGVKKPVWVTLDEYHSFIKQGLITDSMTLSGMTLFENQK